MTTLNHWALIMITSFAPQKKIWIAVCLAICIVILAIVLATTFSWGESRQLNWFWMPTLSNLFRWKVPVIAKRVTAVITIRKINVSFFLSFLVFSFIRLFANNMAMCTHDHFWCPKSCYTCLNFKVFICCFSCFDLWSTWFRLPENVSVALLWLHGKNCLNELVTV